MYIKLYTNSSFLLNFHFKRKKIPFISSISHDPQSIIHIELLDFLKTKYTFKYFHAIDKYFNVLELILINLLICTIEKRPIRYSRSLTHYAKKTVSVMNRNFYSKKLVIRVIDFLIENQYIHYKEAIPGSIKKIGKLRRIVPTQKLIDIFEKYENNFSKKHYDIELYKSFRSCSNDLKVKDYTKRLVPDILSKKIVTNNIKNYIKRKQLVSVYKKQIREINEWYEEHNLSTTKLFTQYDCGIIGMTNKNLQSMKIEKHKHLLKTNMKRIFNNSSLSQGGRLYGKYQQLSKNTRMNLLIDNESVAIIDMKNSHINLLRSIKKLSIFNGDAYELFYNKKKDSKNKIKIIRKINKKLLLTLINSKNIQQAIIASQYIISNILLEKANIAVKISKRVAIYWLNKIKEKHEKIKQFFNSSVGIRLQFIESNIIIQSILRLKNEFNICAYPVHDELIVPKSKAYITKKILQEEYYKLFKQNIPVTIEN